MGRIRKTCMIGDRSICMWGCGIDTRIAVSSFVCFTFREVSHLGTEYHTYLQPLLLALLTTLRGSSTSIED